MNSFKEEGNEQFERPDGTRGTFESPFEHLSDAFEWFFHNGQRARYETEDEFNKRIAREMDEVYENVFGKKGNPVDHPAFCKPGTTIKSVVQRPVMFRKPIEQFFDVSEAIIIEQ